LNVSPELVTLAERYVLESRVASGGMATVWRARDDVLARTVAVKILHPHLAQDESFLERFRREALAAARLSHPNIVAIYDTGAHESADQETDQHFIVMEFCGAGTLASILMEQGALDPHRAADIGCNMLDALGYAHHNGVVHRDIKPANALVTSDGTLKVADFGIAKAAFTTGDITTTGSILGTVTYLAPEQIQGEEPGPRADLYSLGVVLYELLAGRPPFVAENQLAVAMSHANERPPEPRSLRAGIPRALQSVVLHALEKDPDRRFSSAEEMREELSAAVGVPTTVAFAAPEPAPVEATSERPRSQAVAHTRNLMPVILLVAAALVLGIMLPLLFGGPDDGTREPRGGDGGGKAGGPNTLQISQASDFDPHGDDAEEHDEDVPSAWDGDTTSAWTTETYSGDLGKPGVGLLFDLAQAEDVARIEIQSDTPGYSIQVRAGDESPSDETGLGVVGATTDAQERLSIPVESSARYWLVWITDLGANSFVHINEVKFLGP
jgi:eukaryotic-like serine/threonine-protein kinase